MFTDKLYIYDSSSSLDRSQAEERFKGQNGIVTMGMPTIPALHDGLARLVSRGKRFRRVLFQTHGNAGAIFFNHVAITPPVLRSSFMGRYSSLFPGPTKFYFDGCNVAAGKVGWDFLKAVGEVFLTRGGGIAIGFTSLGFGMPSWVPGISGRTVHLTGDVRFIEFRRGGVELSRFPEPRRYQRMGDLIEHRKRIEAY